MEDFQKQAGTEPKQAVEGMHPTTPKEKTEHEQAKAANQPAAQQTKAAQAPKGEQKPTEQGPQDFQREAFKSKESTSPNFQEEARKARP